MRFRRSIGRRSASTSAAARSAFRSPVEALEDRRLFAITLASAGPGGVAAAVPGVDNNNPAVSDDGRFVVFVSTANNLVAGDDNNAADVFVRDRQSNAVALVSAAPDGSAGNAGSGDPGGFRTGYTISGNGRYVVFASDATDLVAGRVDNNNLTDYFVRDLVDETTFLVSVSPSGEYSTASTFGGTYGRPAISDDGRWVTFTATYSDLDPAVVDDDGNQPDVFVRDLQFNVTTQISRPAADATGGGNVSPSPTISADGRYVAFTSSDRLVEGLDEVTFNFEQLWVYDTTGDTIALASLAPDGATHANGHVVNPVISGDGRSVAFLSTATNLVTGFTESNTGGLDAPDIFHRNLDTGATLLVTRAAGSATTGSNGENETPSISSNGRFVAYSSEATNLVSQADGNSDVAGGGNDVFFFDATTGETKLLSVNAAGTAAGNQTSTDLDGDDERGPAMSDDGRYVAFVSSASDLVSGDENPLPEVFVRDTQANTTRRVYAGLTIPGTSTPVFGLGGTPTLAGNGSALALTGSGIGIVGNSADTTANQVFVDNMSGTNGGGNDGGNDGGNNGGGGGGTLVPTVTATLPAAVVGGAKARGATATVNVTNNGTTAFGGPVTVALFASQNATFESGTDTQIVTTTKNLKLAPGQSKPVKLKIAQFPSVADGNYALLAQVSGTGVTAATGVTGNTVNIAAPFVDLSGAFSQSPASAAKGKKARAAVTVSNAGNVDAKGTVPVVITASTDPSGANPVTIATVNAKLALKPGASKAVRLSFAVPAEIASGSYFLTAAIDSTNVIAESNETNNTATAATATAIA